MADFAAKNKSTYANTDWDFYQTGRPPYPSSLTGIIYDYRNRHANAAWDLLVDVGGGSGLAATSFMKEFKTTHNSDPSPQNEIVARAFLSQWAAKRGLKPYLEFSQATGESVHEAVGDKRADLVICATAAHFIDPDGLAASAARMLKPGGTLAVYSYWMPRFPGKSFEFHDTFERAFEAIVLGAVNRSAGGAAAARVRIEAAIQRRLGGNGALDSVPLPADLYEDPTRVYINAGKETTFTRVYTRFMAPTPLGLPSRVASGDRIVHYETGKDLEAEGWVFEVERTFLDNFFNTIRPRNVEESDEAKQAEAEWTRVYEKECPNGKTLIEWPCYLALGTKR